MWVSSVDLSPRHLSSLPSSLKLAGNSRLQILVLSGDLKFLLLSLQSVLELVQADNAENSHTLCLFDGAPKIGNHRSTRAINSRVASRRFDFAACKIA